MGALAAIFLFGMTATFQAEAATYYVKNGGNDGNSGLSDALAWAMVGKVNGFSFQPGDDVYFKCGGTWQNAMLVVDWAGSSANRVIIGAYYLDGSGKEVAGVQGEKPMMMGRPYTDSNPYPPKIASASGDSGSWNGMVGTWGGIGDYVTVENLHIMNSAGGGIVFDDGSGNPVENLIVRNNNIENVHRAGIHTNTCINCLYENNEVHNVSRLFKENPGHGWPPAVVICYKGSRDNVIRGNLIYENYGEGIGVFWGGINTVIENNTLFDNRTAGIDIDVDGDRATVIRNNLLYSTNNREYWRNGGLPTAAVYLTDLQAGVPKTYVYNNFISHFSHAFTFGCVKTTYGGACTSLPQDSIFIINNTVAGVSGAVLAFWGTSYTHCEMRNNIFWQPEGGDYATRPAPAGWTFSNNLWFGGANNRAIGANDVLADPLLTKTGGWPDPARFGLSAGDFKLQSGSPARDRGAAVNIFNNDGFGAARPQGNAWDIGAHEYSSGPTSLSHTLPSPSMPAAGTCKIYDTRGKLVKVAGNASLSEKSLRALERVLPNGVYLYKIVPSDLSRALKRRVSVRRVVIH